jgi:PAS domain S-box-containing protein
MAIPGEPIQAIPNDERGHSEEAVLGSEEQLRLVIDTIPSLVWSCLPDGAFDYVNRRWSEYTGISAQDALGSGWMAAYHPDDVGKHQEKRLASLASGDPLMNEVRLRRADGQYRWHVVHGVPLRNASGNIVKWYGAAADIQDRKRVEDALRRNEAYLAEAQRLGHTGSWAWDARTRKVVHCSEEMFQIYGLDPKESPPTRRNFRQRIHPEDRASVDERFNKVLRNREDNFGEYRLLLPDGAVKYLDSLAHPVVDDRGELMEFLAVARDVTERKRAQQERQRVEMALRASEARWRAVFEASPMGIATSDTGGRLLTANPAFERIVGYSQAELQALQWSDLYADEAAPSDHLWPEAIAGRRASYQLESRFVRKDGEVIWVSESTSYVAPMEAAPAFFASIVVDITERKRIDLERRRLASLVEQAADLMAIADLSGGTPIYLNKAGMKMVGFDSWEEAKQRRGIHYILPEDRAFVNEVLWPAVLQEGCWSGEMRFRHFKTGEAIPILYSAFRIDDPETGQPVNVGNVCRDITDRKRAEAEARENERRYREVQTELAHANRVVTIGHFTASIAHEVSQPIAAAVMNAEAALRWLDRRPPNLDEVRQALAHVINEGKRAGNVITRIRELIRKAPSRKDRLDINRAVLEVIELTQVEAMKHSVSVRTELADSLTPISGDRVQLQQVILNLIINGVEAMSGTVDEPRELLIGTEPRPDAVLVAVRDSGPGLAPEAFERVFDSFYTTKPAGLGLGLSICRSIIEAHGGQLWASANVPRGAIFQFTLPVRAGSQS